LLFGSLTIKESFFWEKVTKGDQKMTNIPTWRDWPHVLRMQQFNATQLEGIVDHALAFLQAQMEDAPLPRLSKKKRRTKSGDKQPRLVRTIFYQSSTRTATTFHDALVKLGFVVHNVTDPNVVSSTVKGESFDAGIMAYTTVGGLGAVRGCDGIVIRHRQTGTPQRAADIISTALGANSDLPPIFVINAGDGKNGQHPTQALADLTTIKKIRRQTSGHFLDGLTVLFPGDIARSRVINSLLYSFGRFDQQAEIKVIFCCPEGLGPKQDMLKYLARHYVAYDFVDHTSFPDAIKQSDIVYMTRLQSEYDGDEDGAIPPFNRNNYAFAKNHLGLLEDGAFVMHPMPVNENPEDPPPEIASELMPLAFAGDPRLPFAQTSHIGQPTRAALLDIIFAGLDQTQSDS
jgi:aspartate carbamoyltransferase catalytic subunit